MSRTATTTCSKPTPTRLQPQRLRTWKCCCGWGFVDVENRTCLLNTCKNTACTPDRYFFMCCMNILKINTHETAATALPRLETLLWLRFCGHRKWHVLIKLAKAPPAHPLTFHPCYKHVENQHPRDCTHNASELESVAVARIWRTTKMAHAYKTHMQKYYLHTRPLTFPCALQTC